MSVVVLVISVATAGVCAIEAIISAAETGFTGSLVGSSIPWTQTHTSSKTDRQTDHIPYAGRRKCMLHHRQSITGMALGLHLYTLHLWIFTTCSYATFSKEIVKRVGWYRYTVNLKIYMFYFSVPRLCQDVWNMIHSM